LGAKINENCDLKDKAIKDVNNYIKNIKMQGAGIQKFTNMIFDMFDF